MNDDIKNINDQILQVSNDWLTKAREVNEAVPYVEKTRQISAQLQAIFVNCPRQCGHSLQP
jgi:hypothetical protein